MERKYKLTDKKIYVFLHFQNAENHQGLEVSEISANNLYFSNDIGFEVLSRLKEIEVRLEGLKGEESYTLIPHINVKSTASTQSVEFEVKEADLETFKKSLLFAKVKK